MAETTSSDRVTVSLHPKSRAALTTLTAEHSLSISETVNRALSLFAFTSDAQAAGDKVQVVRANGETETVVFL